MKMNEDLAVLLLRAAVGGVLIYHGQEKLFGGIAGFAGYLKHLGVPAPELSAWLSGLTEFCGGIVLVLGTGLRIAAIPILFNMLVAVWSSRGNGFSVLKGGIEYPTIIGVVVLALLLAGPGSFTIAKLIKSMKSSGESTK